MSIICTFQACMGDVGGGRMPGYFLIDSFV